MLGDRTFTVTLNDTIFNQGLGQLTPGEPNGATITATIKQLSGSTASVPDNGSSAMLLGVAFVALALLRRTKIAV